MPKYHAPTNDIVKLSPFQLGEQFFKDGRDADSNPYLHNEDSFNRFRQGFRLAKDAHAARTQPHAG